MKIPQKSFIMTISRHLIPIKLRYFSFKMRRSSSAVVLHSVLTELFYSFQHWGRSWMTSSILCVSGFWTLPGYDFRTVLANSYHRHVARNFSKEDWTLERRRWGGVIIFSHRFLIFIIQNSISRRGFGLLSA